MTADLTPAIPSQQAALFEDASALVRLPEAKLKAFAEDYARQAVAGLKTLRQNVGLICWALQHTMTPRAYAAWIAGYADRFEASVRTLERWRADVAKDRHLELMADPARKARSREQMRRSQGRDDKSALPAINAKLGETLPDELPQKPRDDPPAVAQSVANVPMNEPHLIPPPLPPRQAPDPSSGGMNTSSAQAAVRHVLSILQWLAAPLFEELVGGVKAEQIRRRQLQQAAGNGQPLDRRDVQPMFKKG